MHAAGFGVNLLLQAVGIGRFKLRQLPPVEHFARDLYALPCKVLQHGHVGGILPGLAFFAALIAHFAKQDFAQLLRTANGEGLPCKAVNFLFEQFHLHGEFGRQPRQSGAVNLNAQAFHFGQHRHQWTINQFIDAGRLFGAQAQFEMVPQSQRHIGVLRRITGRIR